MIHPGLYIISTPIGNLDDWTHRAQNCVIHADLVLCEDTRTTQKLLHRYDISRKLVSFHDHNCHQRLSFVEEVLQQQKSVALLSDAGTPLISDPGYPLVQLAIGMGVHVYPIPGASAILAGLVASGFPTEYFCFLGFPPKKQADFSVWLRGFLSFPGTMVMYESPHRIIKTLSMIHGLIGSSRHICLGRELTKLFEEVIRGTAQECLEHLNTHPQSQRGEFVVMIGPDQTDRDQCTFDHDPNNMKIITSFVHAMQQRLSAKDMIDSLALLTPVPRRKLYELVHQLINKHES